MKIIYDVIVVGGGASGLMAAGKAAEQGASVILLEKMDRPARKLRITGKGRCNLTNIAPIPEFIEHFGRNGKFLHQAFSQFFSNELISFLNNLGIETVTERGGRVFPKSGHAQEIVDALVKWNRSCGVKIQTRTTVRELIIKEKQISGVCFRATSDQKSHCNISTDSHKYQCIYGKSVIVAVGGASYPATGSTGDGYRLAQSAGHKIIPIRPALVPIMTSGDTAKRLQNLTLKNVSVTVYIDNKKAAKIFGEMQFMSFGISGPIVLALSKLIVDALQSKKQVGISIDLKPALDEKKLDDRLIREFNNNGKSHFRNVLKNLLPSKLIPFLIENTGIPAEKFVSQISGKDRKKIGSRLKDMRLEVTGHRPFAEAIITAGGVDLKEIDPRTMMSRLVNNLYFTGEVLDLDADTGGYNLQAAFSTGWLAGEMCRRF